MKAVWTRRPIALLALLAVASIFVAQPSSAVVTLKVDFDSWEPPAGMNSSDVKSDIMNRVRSNFAALGTGVNVVSNCNTPGDISIVVSNRRTDDRAWGETVNATRGIAWGGEFNTSLPAAGYNNVTTFGRAISGTIAHEAGHLLNATHTTIATSKMKISSSPAEKALTDRHFTAANVSNMTGAIPRFGSKKESSVMFVRGVGSASVPGHEDSNVDVVIEVNNGTPDPIEFGYIDDGEGFVSFFDVSAIDLCVRAATFYPGEVVEFAIRTSPGDVYSMTDFGNMVFGGPIPAPESYEPMLDEEYWQMVSFDFNAMGQAVTGAISVDGSVQGDGMTQFKESQTGVPTLNILTAILLSLVLAGYALYHFTRKSRPSAVAAE
jgi:hypothetical protein